MSRTSVTGPARDPEVGHGAARPPRARPPRSVAALAETPTPLYSLLRFILEITEIQITEVEITEIYSLIATEVTEIYSLIATEITGIYSLLRFLRFLL